MFQFRHLALLSVLVLAGCGTTEPTVRKDPPPAAQAPAPKAEPAPAAKAEPAKPVEQPKAAEKPAEAPKPAEVAKPKPEPKPEVAKPDPKPEPKTEAAKPEPKPEPKPAVAKPEPKPAPKPEPKPEVAVKPAPAAKPAAASGPVTTTVLPKEIVAFLKSDLAAVKSMDIDRVMSHYHKNFRSDGRDYATQESLFGAYGAQFADKWVIKIDEVQIDGDTVTITKGVGITNYGSADMAGTRIVKEGGRWLWLGNGKLTR